MRNALTVLLAVLLAPVSAAEELTRPLYARPATTTTAFNMDVYVEYYDGLKLQEAVDLEGWTAGLDFTLPFNRTMQLRFLLPLRTEAQGVLRSNGEDVDIDGWGGTFRFASLFFEHQLVGRDGGPDRFAYTLGIGHRTGVLETDTGDKYNHRGRSLDAGLRFDRLLSAGGALLLDAELRFFDESDDLNPGSLVEDSFLFGKVTGAWLLAARGRLTPALELTADIGENHLAASLVPELYLRTTESLELKLGVPLGLTSDAPDWGAQARLTLTL